MSDLIVPPVRSAAPGQGQLTYTSSQGQLAATAGTIYTAGNTAGVSNFVSSYAFLIDLWITNTDSSDRTITLYIVPAAGSPGVTNAIASASTVKTGESLHFSNIKTLIPRGGTLQGLASVASKVTYFATLEVYS